MDTKSANWYQIESALKSNQNHGKIWSEIFIDYDQITYEQAKQFNEYKQAAHCLIWSKNDFKLWGIETKAAILMQLRFDGYVGFPGGFIDDNDETWEHGLNRELKEEMNLNEKYFINQSDHFVAHVNHKRKVILHFYVKQVPIEDFCLIEKNGLDSHDYGGEVLGLIRPPLYELSNGRGFNIFLKNQFVGNSLIQLLKTIYELKILSIDEIIKFINKC